jgi:hypothetical protein
MNTRGVGKVHCALISIFASEVGAIASPTLWMMSPRPDVVLSTPLAMPFPISMMDALRVPLKTIQERIGHALTGSFTLDVYGHTLDWKANEDAAKGLGQEIAKAVTETESNFDSGHLTAHQKENFPNSGFGSL